MDDDVSRIAIAVAIVGTFLTLIINLNSFMPKNPIYIISILRMFLYLHFFVVCWYFYLFLIYRAEKLTYKPCNKISDFSVVLDSIMFFIVNKHARKMSKQELRKLILNKRKNNDEHYYDSAVRTSLTFPITILINLFGLFCAKTFIDYFGANILCGVLFIGIILIIFVGGGVLLNWLRFKFIGNQ